jgi:hypothetical protein
MSVISFSRPTGNESPQELADMVAKLQKEVEFLINGNLSSTNVREIGGYLVDDDRIYSKDGDVGLSTTDTGGDDVRYWAGGTDPDTAALQIRKSGKISLRFPGGKVVEIGPDLGGSPYVQLTNSSGENVVINMDVQFQIQSDSDISLVSAKNIYLITAGGPGKNVVLDYDGVTEGATLTLRNEIDAKATKGITLNGGIPIGTMLAIDGGGAVGWAGITLA